MGTALCDLHWSGDMFWRSTPHEFYAACEAGFERTTEGRKKAREREFAKFREKVERGSNDDG